MSETSFLSAAIAEGWKGAGHTRPNPPVGAVVVCDGKIVGRGHHRRCGGDHAEVAAIKDAFRRHPELRPAQLQTSRNLTLYVTLEPCSRPGRVGACTDAIAAAGLSRVVYAVPDPNPKNRNRARRVLARKGIVCARFRGDAAVVAEAERLIAPFAKHVTTGLPFVTVKLAMSLDGKICDNAGRSQWISSKASLAKTAKLRERVDVVLVGAETVRKDNPSLLCHTKKNDDLWRAVVSKSGRLPKNAQIFTDAAKDRTLVYRDPVEAVRDLGRRGFLHILCEGGLGLARSLAAAGLVDEWLTVLAPIVIGDAPLAKAYRFARGRDCLNRVRTA